MSARRPRKGGYYNAALGIAGTTIAVPANVSNYIIHVGAACYVGIGGSALRALNTTEYGVMGAGQWEEFGIHTGVRADESYIHVAAISGTAAVSIMFL